MLHTTDNAAVESLTAFTTSMDYVLTDEGDTAYLYHVRLQDVVAEIDFEAERRLRAV